jgi:hypothetical protein
MLSNESAGGARITTNNQVDQLLKKVRERKSPRKVNAMYQIKDQLNPLNPIKVTKIYTKT